MLYEVKVRPKDDRQPRIIGAVYLDRDDAQVVRMAFSFTRAAFLDKAARGPVRRARERLVDGRFWLPRRQEIEIRRGGTWLDYPVRGIIRGRWEIGDYHVNTGLSPAMFTGPEIVLGAEAQRDTLRFSGRILDSLPPDVRAVTDAEVQPRAGRGARARARAGAAPPAGADAVGARYLRLRALRPRRGIRPRRRDRVALRQGLWLRAARSLRHRRSPGEGEWRVVVAITPMGRAGVRPQQLPRSRRHPGAVDTRQLHRGSGVRLRRYRSVWRARRRPRARGDRREGLPPPARWLGRTPAATHHPRDAGHRYVRTHPSRDTAACPAPVAHRGTPDRAERARDRAPPARRAACDAHLDRRRIVSGADQHGRPCVCGALHRAPLRVEPARPLYRRGRRRINRADPRAGVALLRRPGERSGLRLPRARRRSSA